MIRILAELYNIMTMKNQPSIKKITPFVSLSGRFLVAMPNIDDFRFEKAVIYIYEHTPQGAAGLVVNHPASQMSFFELLEQLQIDHMALKNQPTLLLGGPDKFSNGFVLHSSEYNASCFCAFIRHVHAGYFS